MSYFKSLLAVFVLLDEPDILLSLFNLAQESGKFFGSVPN
jgi:hypothetical protein